MAAELTMPKLSDSMADAVILKWLKSPGEGFRRGEALLEVETDKATVVYEAEADGTLEAILVEEGGSAGVGEPIARLAGDGAAAPAPAPAEPPAPVAAPGRATNGASAAAADPAANGERPNATPVARRTAAELGLSLHDVGGTGPGGRITREDVRRAAAAADRAAAPAPHSEQGFPGSDRQTRVRPGSDPAGTPRGDVTVVEPTPTQATIARRMAESATTIPVFTVSADADVSQVVALRRGARADGREDVPSLNDFVVRAAALALRELPRFNASWVDGRVELYSRVNVGVAVATDDALLVPVVADADRRSLADIAAETRRLADGARRRALRPDDLQGATFTVSNLGMFGVRSFTAIVDPPQVGILAVGGVRREPVEDGDRVRFRDAMTLTLSADHRVVYGADGARFL
ncbi:MAG TPA: dihydrolipoamide acetyltransferase family protein, partial [Gaiellaceae bacterium]|nr:dihydrolipoamide acetyltransferase family protein [Gaiellaceae bacterium]